MLAEQVYACLLIELLWCQTPSSSERRLFWSDQSAFAQSVWHFVGGPRVRRGGHRLSRSTGNSPHRPDFPADAENPSLGSYLPPLISCRFGVCLRLVLAEISDQQCEEECKIKPRGYLFREFSVKNVLTSHPIPVCGRVQLMEEVSNQSGINADSQTVSDRSGTCNGLAAYRSCIKPASTLRRLVFVGANNKRLFATSNGSTDWSSFV